MTWRARGQCEFVLTEAQRDTLGPDQGTVGKRCAHRAQLCHHIRYCDWFAGDGDVFDEPENLVALCRACHGFVHTCQSCPEKRVGTLRSDHIKNGKTRCDECADRANRPT